MVKIALIIIAGIIGLFVLLWLLMLLSIYVGDTFPTETIERAVVGSASSFEGGSTSRIERRTLVKEFKYLLTPEGSRTKRVQTHHYYLVATDGKETPLPHLDSFPRPAAPWDVPDRYLEPMLYLSGVGLWVAFAESQEFASTADVHYVVFNERQVIERGRFEGCILQSTRLEDVNSLHKLKLTALSEGELRLQTTSGEQIIKPSR
jgi:hypothetical protein